MMTRHFRRLISAFAIAAVMVAGSSAAAEGEPSEHEVSQITEQVTREVYSPFCEGKTLQMCPSSRAAEVRREIQEMARDGMNAEEIKQQLLERYGDEYRLHEPSSGDEMGLLGAILGGFAIAGGAVILLAGRLRKDGDDDDGDIEPDGDAPEDDAYLDELRAEYQD